MLIRATVFLTLCAMWMGCGRSEGEYFGHVVDRPDTTHFRWCNKGEPEYIDPALSASTTGTSVARLLFSGLTNFGTDLMGTPVPSIATRWDISEDFREFRFHLRKDVHWSNGRQLNAEDFIYHLTRILHPTTMSQNRASVHYIKNATIFSQGRLRTLQRDVPPFVKGDIVEVVGLNGETAPNVGDDKVGVTFPSSNLRKSSAPLHLRDYKAPIAQAYATVAAGAEVEIIEIRRGWKSWAYVYYPGTNRRYGWVPLSDLNIEPNADQQYTVLEVTPGADSPQRRSGIVSGRGLLMLPEALGMRAEGPFTLVIETSGSQTSFIAETGTRSFRPSPRESVARSPDGWTSPQNGLFVSSGPFHLDLWLPRDKLVLSKSPSYFAADEIALSRFTVLSVSDQTAAVNLYSQGACDAVAPGHIPTSYVPTLMGVNRKKKPGTPFKDFSTVPFDAIYYFALNTEKLSNRHLRRALAMSVDREALSGILGGGEIATSQFVPGQAIVALSDADKRSCGVTADAKGVARVIEPGKYCYRPPTGLAFSVTEARKELELAKQELGANFPTHVDFTYSTGSEMHRTVAEYVQSQWKHNLGLDVQLSSMEWKSFLKATGSGDFSIARMGWVGGSPDPAIEFLSGLTCSSLFNRSRWCSAPYDEMLAAAATMTDRKKRLELLSAAENLALQEAAVIPVFVYTQSLLVMPYVKGLPMNSGARAPMHKIWIDPDFRSDSESKRQ